MKYLAVILGLTILTSCASLPSRTSAMAAQTVTELNNGATHIVDDVKLVGDAARHIGQDYKSVVGAVTRIKDASDDESITP